MRAGTQTRYWWNFALGGPAARKERKTPQGGQNRRAVAENRLNSWSVIPRDIGCFRGSTVGKHSRRYFAVKDPYRKSINFSREERGVSACRGSRLPNPISPDGCGCGGHKEQRHGCDRPRAHVVATIVSPRLLHSRTCRNCVGKGLPCCVKDDASGARRSLRQLLSENNNTCFSPSAWPKPVSSDWYPIAG